MTHDPTPSHSQTSYLIIIIVTSKCSIIYLKYSTYYHHRSALPLHCYHLVVIFCDKVCDIQLPNILLYCLDYK